MARQCETSRAAEAYPPKVLQREKGPSGPSGPCMYREARQGHEKEGYDSISPEPSLWNHTFNTVRFSNLHFLS